MNHWSERANTSASSTSKRTGSNEASTKDIQSFGKQRRLLNWYSRGASGSGSPSSIAEFRVLAHMYLSKDSYSRTTNKPQ